MSDEEGYEEEGEGWPIRVQKAARRIGGLRNHVDSQVAIVGAQILECQNNLRREVSRVRAPVTRSTPTRAKDAGWFFIYGRSEGP